MEKTLDYVLILEKSSKNLSSVKEGGDYFLEGVAAVFGVENSNHRIYEEKEYLPHLDYLKKKIDQNRLVGELDHPKEFDVSLKNISHIITNLDYDDKKRTVTIKVKLLDTPAGKIAKSLVDAGIPISISSRAAGNVKDNKQVEIKKIFTYDLVADPGFENAQLERVQESLYESLGFGSFNDTQKMSVISTLTNINESFGLRKNSNTQIYRIKDTEKISRLLKENTTNNSKNMDNNFVTAEELNEYSLILKKEMNSLKNEMKYLTKGSPSASTGNSSAIEERVQRLEKYSEYLAENLESAIKHGDYLAENLEGSISYNKYLAENLDKAISYAKYLAEHVDGNISYSEYIAENLDNNIAYSKYLAENVDKNISYSEYLAESLDKNISYSEYLAESLDKNISYSEYLAENLDKNISYSEYLAENVDRNISYSEYLAENLDKNISYSEYLAENLDRDISYSEYLAENLDKSISYSDYLGEKVKSGIEYTQYLAESINRGGSPKSDLGKEVNESIKTGKRTSGFSGDYNSLSGKVDQLIENLNKNKTNEIINENKYSFLKLVDDNTKKGFISLNEAEKQKVVKALNEQNYNSGMDVVQIMGSALTQQVNSGEKFLDMMPKELVSAWVGLNESQKASIVAQSKFYKLDTPYQINNFWKTRPGFSAPAANLEQLNESHQVPNNAVKTGVSNSYLQNIAAELDKRFKK
jgi:hypothetical protein